MHLFLLGRCYDVVRILFLFFCSLHCGNTWRRKERKCREHSPSTDSHESGVFWAEFAVYFMITLWQYDSSCIYNSIIVILCLNNSFQPSGYGVVYTWIAYVNKERQMVEYNSSILKGLKNISSYCAHTQDKEKQKNAQRLATPFQITFLFSHLRTH